jgi:ABC-type lipoprotein export system ATPase subunit
MSILKLTNISKSYHSKVGTFDVLKSINLEIQKNSNTFLFGPSGCGKSTLLNIISGMDTPDQGVIFFNEKKIKNHFELLKNEIGIIFQDHYLISELNIIDNMKLKSSNLKNINEIFDYFNINELKEKFPNQLSNGQKQRVCVARALVNMPKLLIADEPTSYLDKENAQLVIDLIINSSKRYNLSTIIASHDLSFKKSFDISYTINDKNLIVC